MTSLVSRVLARSLGVLVGALLVVGAVTAGLAATTSKLTWPLPSAGIVPPVSVTLFAPATGTKVPPQVADPPATGETTRPPAATGLVGWVVDGRLSVNVTLVSATPFGLLSVIVTDDLPPAGIGVEFCGR